MACLLLVRLTLEIKPYHYQKHESSVKDGIIAWCAKTALWRGAPMLTLRRVSVFFVFVAVFEVLALVLRSPSGFNAQPYECVVVTSEEAKKKLSKAMLGANRER